MNSATLANNGNIFSHYLGEESVFRDKKILSSSFTPVKIPHRDAEIAQLTSTLAPLLRGYQPNNVFIYGTCGTGKTICAKFVLKQLAEIAKAAKRQLTCIYINCKMKKVADTEYRLFAQMLKELGEHVPDTGLPTDVIYRRFFSRIDAVKGTTIIVLDEIDALIKKVGDEFLYNLTRINSDLTKAHISIIGITNDLSFRDNLDLRVKSSLSEEEILFKPYNALQLKEILADRCAAGFNQGAINDAILAKCAAIAAQEHGDARRALDLLRVAGECAERMGEAKIREHHVDMAEKKIDMDRVTEAVRMQPKQSQAILYAIMKHARKQQGQRWADTRLLTGDVVETYKIICTSNGLKPLTQRRVSDLIGELDMLGIINARIISKGRYGRTREISLAVQENAAEKLDRLLAERFN